MVYIIFQNHVLETNPFLIPLENISGVDLFLHIVQAAVVAVGDDGLAQSLEFGQIIDHQAAEESAALFQRLLLRISDQFIPE